MSRGARGLSAADLEIWRAVAETIPRRMPGAMLAPRPELPRQGTVGEAAAPLPAPTTPGWSPPPQRAPSGPAEVDRALRRRLAAGRQPVDAVLDLHGMRQGEAHARLVSFMGQAQREGCRVVLVVTGKGRGGGEGAGVLRRLVPLWLAESRLAPLVVGFGTAGRGHGDEGALFIHVRTRHRRDPA